MYSITNMYRVFQDAASLMKTQILIIYQRFHSFCKAYIIFCILEI